MKTPFSKLQKLFFLGAILLFSNKTVSQELPSIVPPSPNAANFHSYGNTRVNHYTGAPNINIPIWNISQGNVNLPVVTQISG